MSTIAFRAQSRGKSVQMKTVMPIVACAENLSEAVVDGQKSIGLIMLTIIGLFPATYALNSDAHLPFRKRGLIQRYVGDDALKRLGRTRWSKHALKVVKHLSRLLDVHYVIVGGGNSERLGTLPSNVRIASPNLAFIGGVRAWKRTKAAGGASRKGTLRWEASKFKSLR